jgi:hypothetical protein
MKKWIALGGLFFQRNLTLNRHDITEILLKVALNIINQQPLSGLGDDTLK